MKARTSETTEPPAMYETENDLPKPARTELNALINQRLADAVDLQMQFKPLNNAPANLTRSQTLKKEMTWPNFVNTRGATRP